MEISGKLQEETDKIVDKLIDGTGLKTENYIMLLDGVRVYYCQ